MCGFAGAFATHFTRSRLEHYVSKMGEELYKRGPDAHGIWSDSSLPVALHHQRLSIQDLSATGSQPMISASGRFIIAFNGEIYNHYALRESLPCSWQGTSDTETLIEAISVWGIEETLRKVAGMFAFALWDKEEKRIYLARDRFGEKPLYYAILKPVGSPGPQLVFASDIAAFRRWPDFKPEIDNQSVYEYHQYSCLRSPNTIYAGVQQVQPGHFCAFDVSSEAIISSYESQWWSTISEYLNCRSRPSMAPSMECETLEQQLISTVQEQSVADVPVGCFLSGGIDSSLITAVLQSTIGQRAKTFTVGFDDLQFDEAPYAREIAQYLGTDHLEYYLSTDSVIQAVMEISSIYSEPFADASQLPTYLICNEARKSGLKVVLTGDGGDELFFGYNRYLYAQRLFDTIAKIPDVVYKPLIKTANLLPGSLVRRIASLIPIADARRGKLMSIFGRLDIINKPEQLYESLIGSQCNPNQLFSEQFYAEIKQPSTSDNPCFHLSDRISNIEAMSLSDLIGYLPNDILTKVDRASMHVGLETRAPFLDHRVAIVAWQLSQESKLSSSSGPYVTKKCLRSILAKYIPTQLYERPKAGFGVPIAELLRGPLLNWSKEILFACMGSHEIYNKKYLNLLWQSHQSRKADHSRTLWTILMYKSWYMKHMA